MLNAKLSEKADSDHNHDTRYYMKSEIEALIGKPLYSSDLFIAQGGGRLLYYDSETANTPYKSGITQATEGVAITVGDWGNYLTTIAIPKGGSTMYIYSRNNGITNDWRAVF